MDQYAQPLLDFYNQYKSSDRDFKEGEMVIGQDLTSNGHDLYVILEGPFNAIYKVACLSKGIPTFGELPKWRIIGRYDIEKTTS